MTAQFILMAAAIIVIGHFIVMRITLEAAQPIRLKLAEVADELLSTKDLPKRHKLTVEKIAEDAFSPAVTFRVFLNVPRHAFDRMRKKQLPDPFADIRDTETRNKLRHLTDLFILSSAAANPFVFSLLFVEFFIVATILRLAKALDGAPRAYRSAAQRTILRVEASAACPV